MRNWVDPRNFRKGVQPMAQLHLFSSGRTGFFVLATLLLSVASFRGIAAAPTADRLGAETTLPLVKASVPALASLTAAASMDIMEIDQAAHRLYLADRSTTGVDVFDVSAPQPRFVKTIDTGSPPNGVSTAPNVKKVFAGLNDSTLAIIDVDPASASADTVIARLNTGGEMRADEMDYDPVDRKLYVANSGDKFVTVIDAVRNTIIKRIDGLGEALEQPRYNAADGMMYLAGSGDNVLYKFNPVTDVLVKVYAVGDDCHPNGLAINPAANQALLGCSNRSGYDHAAIWDFSQERVVALFLQVRTGDGAIYDAVVNRYFFASQSNARGPAMSVFVGDPAAFLTNVKTATGAGTVAYDETNRMVYGPNRTVGEAGIVGFKLPDS
jgi:YVTN family beta-propeller protein